MRQFLPVAPQSPAISRWHDLQQKIETTCDNIFQSAGAAAVTVTVSTQEGGGGGPALWLPAALPPLVGTSGGVQKPLQQVQEFLRGLGMYPVACIRYDLQLVTRKKLTHHGITGGLDIG